MAPDGVALLRGKPFLENRLRIDPAQEILGSLLVLRIAHDHVNERAGQCEMPGGAGSERRMKNVVLHRLAALGEVGVRLFLGFEVNRGAVVGQADRAG